MRAEVVVVTVTEISGINLREKFRVSLNGIIVEAGVVAGLAAGLPGPRTVALVTAGHAGHMSPALHMVEVARAVPAPGVEAGV